MKKAIGCALGKTKADFLLKGGFVVNVFTGRTELKDVAVLNGKIVGVGSGYSAKKIYDVTGKYVLPGLIDSHVHIESSKLTPPEFCRIAALRGVTTVIADPHEIANVCGEKGIRYMIESSEGQAAEILYMLPSCVPSTPFESAGAEITSSDAAKLIKDKKIFGLAEFMNYVGVVGGDAECLKKLESAAKQGKPVDGHCPGLSGNSLDAYLNCGIGTDHEILTPDEAYEKISKGMYVMLRYGTAAKNLEENCGVIDEFTFRRCLLCADDVSVTQLTDEGYLDESLRILVRKGIKPETAVIIATLNAAECYGLKNKGAVCVGYDADIAVFDSLTSFRAETVFKKGKPVVENGRYTGTASVNKTVAIGNTVNIKPFGENALKIRNASGKARVIKLIPNSLVTEEVTLCVETENGEVNALKSGLLKLAVFERHNATGNVGVALLCGYGLKNGAVATTVAHDSHNVIVIGDDDATMVRAVREIERIGGGITVCGKDGAVVSLPLEIAGLMTDSKPETLYEKLRALTDAAYKLGVNREINPFMPLSFLALPVIPKLKLTDKGLFDAESFRFVSAEA